MALRPRDRGTRPVPALAGLVAAAVVTLTALTGCSGGESTDADASSSPTSSPTASGTEASPASSPSASASSSASTRPRPPKPPRTTKDTVAARKAFAAFVVARWSYALDTNDASAVTELSPPGKPCAGCKDLAAELAKRRKQHWYVDFPGAKVRTVGVTAASGPAPAPAGTYVARAKIDIPASRSYFKDGSFRNDNPAHRGATFEVQMRYANKKYALLSFQVL